jgi:hypothetical protein
MLTYYNFNTEEFLDGTSVDQYFSSRITETFQSHYNPLIGQIVCGLIIVPGRWQLNLL